MRTTVSLDEDVVAKLRDSAPRSGTKFEETLNDCLRRGFDKLSDDERTIPFTVKPRSMGLRPGINLDDIGGVLELLDRPASP